MIGIPNSISQDSLKDIAETLNCTPAEFYKQLIKKAVLQQISKIPKAEIINTEETIKQKTSFPYIIFCNPEFYFIRINFKKIPHKNKITREKSNLEKILRIIPQGIFCFNPSKQSPKRTIKKLKNKKYKLIDLGYDEKFLKNLQKLQDIDRLNRLNPELKYISGKGFFKLDTNDKQKKILFYCLGQNLSKKEKRKGCKKSLIEEPKKDCTKCRNYLELVLESEIKTQNPLNRQAIEYLESIEKKYLRPNNDLETYKPTNTELSKLAQKLL